MWKKRLGIMLCMIICVFLCYGCASGQEEDQPQGADAVEEIETGNPDAAVSNQTGAETEAVTTENEDAIQGAEASKEDETENEETGSDETQDGSGTGENSQALQESAIAEGGTPFGMHGALHVSGSVLQDVYGNTVALRGVSTHGLSWFPQYANREAFLWMRDEWGIQVVRLAMYTAEYNGYCTGDENNRNLLKQKIYDSVEAASELGLYVIVDWHILSDQNPAMYQDQAIAFFREVSEKLSGYENVIYEICNEPNGGTSWQDIKAYAETVIPVIRENAPGAVIIVGTPTWSQDVDQAANNPITAYDNIMYALHFYADTHRDSLRDKMTSAIRSGLPVFVSEFGICDASGSGAVNTQQADIWMELLEEYHVSSCIWNLSNKEETSAMIRSDCAKTSGWTYEELSASGQWFVDYMKAHGAGGSEDADQRTGQSDPEQQNQIQSGQNTPGGGEGQQSQAQEEERQQNTAQGVLSAAAASGKLCLTVNVTNSWESDGKYYYQCEIRLENQGTQKINGWSLELGADQNLEISQSWCGIFQVKEGKIQAVPESYNAVIEAASVQENIGVIICAQQQITSLNASVTVSN